jgi:integrase
MTHQVTAADLARLDDGARMPDGGRAYWRKNADGTVSGYQRLPDGRDVLAGRTVKGRPPLKAEVEAIREAFLRLRTNGARAAMGKRAEGRVAIDVDPSVEAKPEKMAPGATLGMVWRAMLHALLITGKWSARNVHVNKLRVQKHLRPTPLWDRPIQKIDAQDLQVLLAPLRASTPNQELKLWGLLSMVFTHAQACDVIDASPVPKARAMMDNIAKRPTQERFAAYTTLPELRKLVVDIRNMNGELSMRSALLLQAFTCQRTGELVPAEWSEFSLDTKPATWTIPRGRMKVKGLPYAQVLHLPAPVVKWLRTLPRTSQWVFPNDTGTGPIRALDKAMRDTLGRREKHVPHGWRAALETLADDGSVVDAKTGGALFSQRWIDAVLDHKPQNVKKHYRREQAVEGGGHVLAWWCEKLGGPA